MFAPLPLRFVRPRQTRTSPSKLLPVEMLVDAIEIVLHDLGGSAPSRVVVEKVGWLLEDDWTDLDLQPVLSGQLRWQQRVGALRTRLCEEGILDWGAPHGVWRLR